MCIIVDTFISPGFSDILIKNSVKSLWISLSVCNTGAYNRNKCLNIAKHFLTIVSKWFNTILRVQITSSVLQSNYSGNIPIGMKIWMACRIIIKIFVIHALNSLCETLFYKHFDKSLKVTKIFVNHRMVRVGRDLKDHLFPTPLPWAGTVYPV